MSDSPKVRRPWIPDEVRYQLIGLKYLREWRGNRLDAAARFVNARFFPRKTVLYYPDRPGLRSAAVKMCAILGYRITTDPTLPVDASVLYQYATHVDLDDALAPTPDATWLNHACRDISKRRVEAAFRDAFGYRLDIEPTRFEGELLEKSDENAVKNAKVRLGPLGENELREGYVYERLVDNRTEDGQLIEYRVPVIDGRVPLVTVGIKPIELRFGLGLTRAWIEPAERCFTRDELKRIAVFCELVGLDYGELDVVRDAGDGRAYIVDANNTPHSPTSKLSPEDRSRWLGTMSSKYAEALAKRQRLAPNRRLRPQPRKG